MTFPSLKKLLQSAQYVFRRFPFEMLFAFIGTAAAITNVELKNINTIGEGWCIRLMMTANLGVVISLAATLFCESSNFSKQKHLLFRSLAALFAAALLFCLNPFVYGSDYIRFFLLSLAAHLLVAFSPFIREGFIQGFWQFNKTLFLRILTSVLYSTVLYLGLAAALGAMNFLFNMNFEWDTFFILWICIAGLFNTLFFLAGLPDDSLSLDQDFSYPKGLKIFTQYVLIPLATVYVVILLAYEIKILVQWSLPKGMASNLILGYAVFGILSILLVFPIKDQEENKWIKTYARSFYFLMLPLLILLFLAIGTRIFNYGITEYRYFLIVLACWLLFITIYFLVSKKQNIKLIPISLCLVTLLSIYGPQSAFSVSMYAQKNILIRILKRNHAFDNGKLIPVKKIYKIDGERAVSTLEYLMNHYELSILQPYISKDLTAVSDSLSKVKSKYDVGTMSRYELQNAKIKWVTNYLNLTAFAGYRYSSAPYIKSTDKSYYLKAVQDEIIKVKGYDFMIDEIDQSNEINTYQLDDLKIKTTINLEKQCSISIANEKVIFNLKALVASLIKNESKLKTYAVNEEQGSIYEYSLPNQMLSFTNQTEHFRVTLKIKYIRFTAGKVGQVKNVTFINGAYLVNRIK